ncbi:hypothetical protein WJX73_002085 [Symbiochloris irregularis]|uniref:PUM-HD domain-containing protein n=1 Tax=Symbiochloris irregularis TaxID=706552 RepID=A0AAW1NMK4_9CHLO
MQLLQGVATRPVLGPGYAKTPNGALCKSPGLIKRLKGLRAASVKTVDRLSASSSGLAVLQQPKDDRDFRPCLEDLHGKIHMLCMDKAGSRYVEGLLVDASAEEVTWDQMARSLQGRVLAHSQDRCATFILLELLPLLDQSWQVKLVQEMQGQVIRCVANKAANHVIRACLAYVQPTSRIHFIVQEIVGTVPSAIMQSGAPTHKVQITHRLQDHVVNLSMQREASRIVQQMLDFGSSEQQDAIMSRILGEETDGKFAVHVARMAPHRYGTFVLQEVLAMCPQDQQDRLAVWLQALIDKHGPANYSRQLCEQVDALLEAIDARDYAAAVATAEAMQHNEVE